MRSRYSLAVAAMLLLAGCGEPDPAPPAAPKPDTGARPNVVMIMIDTLRGDSLGCYGYPEGVSPFLDDTAAKGLLFEDVIAQCPWTRPSIGSFLTSRYPRDLGLYREKDEILNDRFVTLAEALRDSGYTALGYTANPNINGNYNFHQGFEVYEDSKVVFGWMDVPEGAQKRGKVSLPTAPSMFGRALEAVQARAGQGPFYLQFNLMEVHEWVVRRKGSNMLRPAYEGLFKAGKYVKYRRMTRQVDDDIRDFVTELTALPGWEDTLFVFVSDHGEGLGDHPGVKSGMYHGRHLYESCIRVPLIFYRTTGAWDGQRVAPKVRLLDLMPTLLDYLDVPPPAGMAGISLMPLIEGIVESPNVPEYFFVETQYHGVDKVGTYGPAWKFIESRKVHSGIAPKELQARGYGQEKGLVTNRLKDYPEEAAAHQAYLTEWDSSHGKTPPSRPTEAVPEAVQEQLDAIGYGGD